MYSRRSGYIQQKNLYQLMGKDSFHKILVNSNQGQQQTNRNMGEYQRFDRFMENPGRADKSERKSGNK